MKKKVLLIFIIFVGFIFLFSNHSFAAPAIWEADFGPAIDDLTGMDDDEACVELSFDFPFDGINFRIIWVGTNGALQLGNMGVDAEIDYDVWSEMFEFYCDLYPIIAPFITDLDLYSTGTIHFNDFGDRAVFTWNEVGTNKNETALLTFQVQLHRDGTIVFAYNGILDDPAESLLDDLDEGIVVGITTGYLGICDACFDDCPDECDSCDDCLDVCDSCEECDTCGNECEDCDTCLEECDTCNDPGTADFSQAPFTGGMTIHERWCYDTADECSCNAEENYLTGPINTEFDLDQLNIVFTPTGNGFRVSFNYPGNVPIPGSNSSWPICFISTLYGY